ncbi:ARF GAP with effector function(s) [Taxawa tesnikishii (nom. ined.)]|nr:ARF GAP with effector function(s) [Dothideales sp. JES 119]
MSRRPNPAADRAAQNQQTLKSLVKIESNKTCADCKRNKHPRWASWNLGIFICIRCSGIHRGMGTHISRVKSVDLDSWTDEQLQSMLRWGNARANKYWEAKLAPGHVPSEAKIENFIRTKYDSKRWAMDGPMPDPATLDVDGDDDVPLNVVQEKAKLDRSSSLRNGNASQPARQPVSKPAAPVIDLFGDDSASASAPAPARPSTVEPTVTSRPPPPKAPAAPSKQTKPGDSLLGLDFFGGAQSAPCATIQRCLQSSIHWATAIRPKAAQTPSAFGGLTSPPLQSPTAQQSFGGLNDAFSGLNFTSTPAAQPPAAKPSPFAGLTSPSISTRQSSITSPNLSGGGFFDTKPAPAAKTSPPPPPKTQHNRMSSGFGDFGDFTSAGTASAASAVRSPAPPTASSMGDLFDLSAPAPTTTTASRSPAPATPSYSAFNISNPAPAPKPAAPQQTSSAFSALGNMDAWGSNDAWSTPDPAPAPAPAPAAQTSTYKAPAGTSLTSDFGGWGSNTTVTSPKPAGDDLGGWGSAAPASAAATSKPTVAEEDDFGGWSSAASPGVTGKPATGGGFGASDDPFGNPWG